MKYFRPLSFKQIIICLILFGLLCSVPGCGSERKISSLNTSAAASVPNPIPPAAGSTAAGSGGNSSVKALYLGVANYGGPAASKENMDSFRYRFKINDKEYSYYMDNGDDYKIQNTLKEGYMYNITVTDGTVTAAELVNTGEYADYKPVISGEPGERTIKNLIKTAFSPVGTALYVYGGGWNWQDTGSGNEARTIGISPSWIRFFKERNEEYTYRDDAHPSRSYYPFGGFNEYYYAGLDCSGYLGWVLYNTFEKEDMKEGYVTKSGDFAKSLADKGLGTLTKTLDPAGASYCFKTLPGDIVSIEGHTWLSLGTCSDGSTLILHSTPSPSRSDGKGGGVQIGAIGNSKECEAYTLARNYMARYYPDWYSRYNIYTCNPVIYFDLAAGNLGCFSWDTTKAEGLSDPDNFRALGPGELLTKLF